MQVQGGNPWGVGGESIRVLLYREEAQLLAFPEIYKKRFYSNLLLICGKLLLMFIFLERFELYSCEKNV